MCKHLVWNQVLHSSHIMASWLFLTFLWHSPQGYLGVAVFLGPGFLDTSPQAKSSLLRLRVLMPLGVYGTLPDRKCFARCSLFFCVNVFDADLRVKIRKHTRSIECGRRLVWPAAILNLLVSITFQGADLRSSLNFSASNALVLLNVTTFLWWWDTLSFMRPYIRWWSLISGLNTPLALKSSSLYVCQNHIQQSSRCRCNSGWFRD